MNVNRRVKAKGHYTKSTFGQTVFIPREESDVAARVVRSYSPSGLQVIQQQTSGEYIA
jgi:hypothetical protein